MTERATRDEELDPQRVVIRDKRRIDPETGEVRDDVPPAAVAAGTPPVGATPAGGDLQRQLDERTADLQRVTAEYANYRRRVERDRLAVAEQAAASLLVGLLPVLDDIDRARQHGDLTGPFKSVAETLEATVTKLGLEKYGAAGDPFDPTVHEALTHTLSAEVEETTCSEVFSPGYRLGERVLRPARVAVADPALDAGPSADKE